MSVEVFWGPAAKVRGVAAACWSAAAGNSAASLGDPEETGACGSPLLILDVGAGLAVVVNADGRGRLAKQRTVFRGWRDLLTPASLNFG